MSYDTDNEIRSCRCNINYIVCIFLLCVGKIMERMNYTSVWWKICREHRMSPYATYESEWYFDYDTDYSKDRLSLGSTYSIKDEYDRVSGVYYGMCR